MNKLIKKLLGKKPYRTVVIITVLLLLRYTFPFYNVATGSMTPTINKRDFVIAFRFAYLFNDPKKDDIAVFEPVEGISPYDWIHRIVAISGESFPEMNDHGRKDVLTNTKILNGQVPENYFYQCGDNRKTSYHGVVPKNLIKAKVIYYFTIPQ